MCLKSDARASGVWSSLGLQVATSEFLTKETHNSFVLGALVRTRRSLNTFSCVQTSWCRQQVERSRIFRRRRAVSLRAVAVLTPVMVYFSFV